MAISTGRLANVQALYVDGSITTMNIATLPWPGQLGQFLALNDKLYQLVQFHASTPTIAAGSPVIWADFRNMVVTADYDITGSGRNFPAGIALLAMTASNYGLIQVRGEYLTVVSDGANDGAVGDTVIQAAVDGQVDIVVAGTAPTYIPYGICTVAEAASAIGVMLTMPLNGA